MHDILEKHRLLFNKYRNLVALGNKLRLCTITKTERADVLKHLEREDLEWIRAFLRKKSAK